MSGATELVCSYAVGRRSKTLKWRGWPSTFPRLGGREPRKMLVQTPNLGTLCKITDDVRRRRSNGKSRIEGYNRLEEVRRESTVSSTWATTSITRHLCGFSARLLRH